MSDIKPAQLDQAVSAALTRDHWSNDRAPELSTVPTSLIGDVHRAAEAIGVIARLVHNSICEPSMSGAESLGQGTHLGLLSAAELIGRYLGEVGEKMRECASAADDREARHG